MQTDNYFIHFGNHLVGINSKFSILFFCQLYKIFQ